MTNAASSRKIARYGLYFSDLECTARAGLPVECLEVWCLGYSLLIVASNFEEIVMK